jgi:putative endonuclease
MRVASVYLLRCADDSLYCGWTTDVERRLAAHRSGTASRYTRSRRPVELALVISVADRPAALREEARIKRLPREAKLELIACHDRDIEDVEIRGNMIRLAQLLKLADLAGSGAGAKEVLRAGRVSVNGEAETRPGRQLHHGDVVAVAERTVRVV